MSVIKTDIDRKIEYLVRYYEDILKYIPEAKQKALAAGADVAYEELLSQIDKRVQDQRGKVKGWQEIHLGSKGGYAAVRPKKEDAENHYGKSYGYSVAQVTSYIEHGHAIPRPTGKNKKYTPRFQIDKNGNDPLISGENGLSIVRGRMFYSYAKMNSMESAIKAMEDILEELTEEFADLLYDLIPEED